jgi:hypothetical protein
MSTADVLPIIFHKKWSKTSVGFIYSMSIILKTMSYNNLIFFIEQSEKFKQI